MALKTFAHQQFFAGSVDKTARSLVRRSSDGERKHENYHDDAWENDTGENHGQSSSAGEILDCAKLLPL